MSPVSRVEFDYLRCEMNDVELPGVVYDLDNSTNNQFNLRYIIQEDRQGPKQFLFQTWYQQTNYHGDSLRQSKQDTLYYQFFTLPASTEGDFPVNTDGRGRSDSLGVRALRTFGDRDSVQWTVGADWRRYVQVYRERNLDASGTVVLSGGDVYGIPKSRLDDYGASRTCYCPFPTWFPSTWADGWTIARPDWTRATRWSSSSPTRASTTTPRDSTSRTTCWAWPI